MSSQINIIKKYNIKAGNLLYFDFDGDGVYTHAAIISSVNAGIKYCEHTKDRRDYPLYSDDNKNASFMILMMRWLYEK